MELQGTLDESLARTAVLETGNKEAQLVAEVSHLRCDQNEREFTALQDRFQVARTALAYLQAIQCRCSEGERRTVTLVEQLDISEHREVWTRNERSAVRQKLGDAQEDAARSQEELTHFQRRLDSVLNDIGSAPDAMGDLGRSKVGLLEARVRDAIAQSLTSLTEQLQAAARGDSSPNCLTDVDSSERRLFVWK